MTALLILAEHDEHGIKPATLACLSAAQQLSHQIDVLLVGTHAAQAAPSMAQYAGIRTVLVNEDACYDHGVAETIAPLLESLTPSYQYLLAPATTFGKNILPRVAARLDIAMVSDVIAIVNAHTFKRPIYAGNAIATIEDQQPIKILSIRTTAFHHDGRLSEQAAAIEFLHHRPSVNSSQFVEQQLTVSERPELTAARVIVSGGRALQSADNFKALLTPLAEKLNAAIGASRAAVDAGFAPNDYQVGQTGKIVAPDLYIAIGISGAIQHVAGMKDSKVVVAINKDADAPIFQMADYGLVGDLYQIVPELTQKLP